MIPFGDLVCWIVHVCWPLIFHGSLIHGTLSDCTDFGWWLWARPSCILRRFHVSTAVKNEMTWLVKVNLGKFTSKSSRYCVRELTFFSRWISIFRNRQLMAQWQSRFSPPHRCTVGEHPRGRKQACEHPILRCAKDRIWYELRSQHPC
jgi:hypothetical protein